jgi:hypothetical protein
LNLGKQIEVELPMSSLPALSRLMQSHGHKVIGKKLIAVLANITKKREDNLLVFI